MSSSNSGLKLVFFEADSDGVKFTPSEHPPLDINKYQFFSDIIRKFVKPRKWSFVNKIGLYRTFGLDVRPSEAVLNIAASKRSVI